MIGTSSSYQAIAGGKVKSKGKSKGKSHAPAKAGGKNAGRAEPVLHGRQKVDAWATKKGKKGAYR